MRLLHSAFLIFNPWRRSADENKLTCAFVSWPCADYLAKPAIDPLEWCILFLRPWKGKQKCVKFFCYNYRWNEPDRAGLFILAVGSSNNRVKKALAKRRTRVLRTAQTRDRTFFRILCLYCFFSVFNEKVRQPQGEMKHKGGYFYFYFSSQEISYPKEKEKLLLSFIFQLIQPNDACASPKTTSRIWKKKKQVNVFSFLSLSKEHQGNPVVHFSRSLSLSYFLGREMA